MLSTDRLTETTRTNCKALISAGASRVTDSIRCHGRAFVYAGAAALALTGAGTGIASAATVSTPSAEGSTAQAARVPASWDRLVLHAGPATGVVQEEATLAAVPQSAGRSGAQNRTASWHGAARRVTWGAVSGALNRQTNPVAAAHHELPAADKLLPVGVTGTQSWMPISASQFQDASTIVRRALDKRMGVRSAVIAVATAMQESRLVDIDYGTGDSLGLFQQQSDMGWGSPQQILNPVYSSDVFLSALGRYQASDPGWAEQPLWQTAQGVQGSAAPYAYAQWESEAAHLVQRIAMRVVR